jgi:hypothetical protein
MLMRQNRSFGMYKLGKRLFLTFSILTPILLVTGCATVDEQHPMLVTKEFKPGEKQEPFASVYFIRPKPYKSKGVANKKIYIEYQGKLLLSIDEGNYILLRIKPSSGGIKVFNQTKFTNKQEPITVWRERKYTFIEGKTYFIYLKRDDEGFRGIFFDPQPVHLEQAKKLIDTTWARGEARDAPIDKLVHVDEAPDSAIQGQTPALPENVYKHEHYFK